MVVFPNLCQKCVTPNVVNKFRNHPYPEEIENVFNLYQNSLDIHERRLGVEETQFTNGTPQVFLLWTSIAMGHLNPQSGGKKDKVRNQAHFHHHLMPTAFV